MKGQFEKEIKLRNFEEHYSQIIRDIDLSNKELSELRKLLVEKNNELSEFDKKISIAYDILNQTILNTNLETEKLNRKKEKEVKAFEERRREIEKIIDESKKSVDKAYSEIKRLEIEKFNSIELINEINKDTASLTETRDKLQEEISQNKKVISSSIDKAIKEKDSIQDDIDSLNEIKKNIQSEINLLDSKKESLSEEYNNKVTLIKHGQEALKEREEALMAKEQNFEVIKARFQKKFEQEYPGRTVSV